MLRQVEQGPARWAGRRVLLLSGPAVRSTRRGRLRLTVEQLESRTLLAGNVCSLADCATLEGGSEVEPRVAMVLQITAADGTPLTSVTAGQDFVLHVLTEDLRAAPRGVFAAYLDMNWDATLAEVTGPLSYGSAYFNGSRDHVSVSPGFIDEGGAFSGLDELGGGLHEVFSVPLRATAAGEVVFTTDPAEDLIDQVLVYDIPNGEPVVGPAETRYGQAALVIAPPGDAAGSLPPADVVEAPLDEPLTDHIETLAAQATAADSQPDSGAAQAAALSAETAVDSAEPAGDSAASAETQSAPPAEAPSLLVGALLALVADDQADSAGSSGSTASDGDGIDPALATSLLTDAGPL